METNRSIDILWDKYLSGNKEVFGDIYLHHYPNLYAYGKTITSHSEVIDGAIQELFMKFWQKPPSGIKSIEQYLFVSFRHQLFRQLRRNKRYFTKSIDDSPDAIPLQKSAEDQFIDQESGEQRKAIIREALESLPPRRREAIYLKYFQDKSTEEISAIMNIREEMVRNYIYKGIKALRAQYPNPVFLLIISHFMDWIF